MVELKNNKNPLNFGDVTHVAIETLERKFPEISMSLKNDKRGTFLKSVLNAYNSLLSSAERNAVKTVDPETELKKAAFIKEKRKMFLMEAPQMTILGKGDNLIPQPVSNALRLLGVYTKIAVDPETNRLLAPHTTDTVTYRGQKYPTFYESTGQQRYLSQKMLSGIVCSTSPWDDRLQNKELQYQINRIPEVKVIRAYIKYGTSEKFYNEVSNIQNNFAKLKNPSILGRRIASHIRKLGKVNANSNPTSEELQKFMIPSDNANYETLKTVLTSGNLNQIDEYKYKKFAGEFRNLLERGKLTQDAKTLLAKKLQLYSKDVAETYVGAGI